MTLYSKLNGKTVYYGGSDIYMPSLGGADLGILTLGSLNVLLFLILNS